MSEELGILDWSHFNTTAYLDDLPFHRKLPYILKGLTAPTCEGHAKWSRFQLKRSNAAILAFFVPMITAAVLGILMGIRPKMEELTHSVTYKPPKKEDVKDLDKIKEAPKKLDTKKDQPVANKMIEDMLKQAAMVKTDYDKLLPDPIPNDKVPPDSMPVLLARSPLKMRQPITGGGGGRRNQQGNALNEFGGEHTADSVLYALRWLKTKQNEDGTWGKTKPALTSLALLAYLAHAETPGSEEFGATVAKGLRWLMDNQTPEGRFKGSDNHEYSLPIAAYALSEAYSMTQIPDVKYSAEKAVGIVVKGQHADGGWDYNCKISERNDTSYAGWCIQAIKAGMVAELNVDGIEDAAKRAVAGLRQNDKGNNDYGGVGYTGGSQNQGLPSVGVLCMQMLGQHDAIEVERGLRTLGLEKFKFDLTNPGCGKNGLYYWYYTTQAMFQKGGQTWTNWNESFSDHTVSKQNVIPKEQSGYKDHLGQDQAIGYWDLYQGHGSGEGDEFGTVLCTLQLEVYYRYLPSYKIQKAVVEDVFEPLHEDFELKINFQPIRREDA